MKNIVYVLLIFILTNKCFGIEYAYGSEDSGFFTREQSGWILGTGLGFANVKHIEENDDKFIYEPNRFQLELLAGMQLFFGDTYASRIYFTFAYLPNDMSIGFNYDLIVINFVNKSSFNMGFYAGMALGVDIFSYKYIEKNYNQQLNNVETVESFGMYVTPNLGLRFVINKVHQLDLSFQYRIILIGESRKTIAGSLRYIYNFEW